MTEKRFIIIGDNNIEFLMESKLLLPIYDNGERLSLKSCCDVLNEQHEENLELKHDNKRLVKFIMSKGYNLKDYLDWLKEEVWK